MKSSSFNLFLVLLLYKPLFDDSLSLTDAFVLYTVVGKNFE